MLSTLAFGLSASLLPIIASAAPQSVRNAPPSFQYIGDPAYGVDTSTLAAAVTCPYPFAPGAKPVLLVHGTGSTGEESWMDGYVPALYDRGYTPCFVTLPARSMNDAQESAAYVAWALHYTSYRAGFTQTAVIAHSQGNPNTQWALRFFPSTRAVTRAYVGLAPDFYGVSTFNLLCDPTRGLVPICQAALWQQSVNSEYITALTYRGQKAEVPTTLVWTETDDVVIPPEPNAQLSGAPTIPVQKLCPGRITDHFLMVIDAAAFALALDALDHGGHADLARTKAANPNVCASLAAGGTNVTLPFSLRGVVDSVVGGVLLTGTKLPTEPQIKPYAAIANQ